MFFVWHYLLLPASLLSSTVDLVAMLWPPNEATLVLSGLLLPKHQKPPCLACVRANHLPQRATEDSPDLTCCVCLSPKCSILYQCRLAQKGSILISHKKWVVHIIVSIFSFHYVSDIKKKKKKRKEEKRAVALYKERKRNTISFLSGGFT